MEISKNIFRGYDIRGIVPEEINENVAKEIGQWCLAANCRRRFRDTNIAQIG